jgi:hypothetical protein
MGQRQTGKHFFFAHLACLLGNMNELNVRMFHHKDTPAMIIDDIKKKGSPLGGYVSKNVEQNNIGKVVVGCSFLLSFSQAPP